jgi:hypothetical protein
VPGQKQQLTPEQFQERYGRKPVDQMSDQELLQHVVDKAAGKFEGKGPRVGQKIHKEAELRLNRYKDASGKRQHLLTEPRFKDGEIFEKGMGTKGSVVPDVFDKNLNIPYDYKTGGAYVTADQRVRYAKSLPGNEAGPVEIVELKPRTPQQ